MQSAFALFPRAFWCACSYALARGRVAYRRKLDGVGEAQPVALTCSVLPDRHGQWTPRLLAGRMVALRHVASPEAKRLADRLEIHHTPEHGSRLNIAVIELSALGRQCLDGQIEDGPTLARRIGAWQRAARNAAAVTVAWRFTTADARIKVRKLYPSIDG